MYRRSAELGEEILAPGSADLVAMAVNYGATLHERGRFHDADRILSEIAATTLRVLPEGAAGIGQSQYWYGRNLTALGRPSEAAAALQRAEGSFAPTDPRLSRARADRGVALAAMGRRAEAEALLTEAATELAETGFEPRVLRQLVAFYTEGGQAAEAETYRTRLAALEAAAD